MNKSKNKRFLLYRFLRLILRTFFKVYYNPTILNKENLRVEGPVIIAGNHRHVFDQCWTVTSTRRIVRYMAKKEYFDGEASFFGSGNRFTRWISKKIVQGAACIPVDRNTKDENAKQAAVDVLNDGGCLGIFPEGTRNKTDAFLLPFKFGVVSLAKKTNATIIPFGITGEHKFRSKDLCVRFGEPFNVDNMTLEEANDKLFDTVKNLMEENLRKD